MKSRIRGISDEENANMDSLISELRGECLSVPGMKNQLGTFTDGSLGDLDVLDYLYYEDIVTNLSADALEGIGFCFGNVLVCSLGFQWAVAEKGSHIEFVLSHANPFTVIRPFRLLQEETGDFYGNVFKSIYDKIVFHLKVLSENQ